MSKVFSMPPVRGILAIAVPNTNLLDNAYWVGGGSQQGGGQFPINQRGQTSYSGAGAYCIDRWYRGYTDDAVLTLHDGYISMAGAENAEIIQRLEHLYLGKTLTASVLLQDGTLFSVTGTMPATYSGGYLNTDIYDTIPNTGGAALNLSYYDNRLRFIIICPAGSNVKAVAAKLERGSTQTLARQDGDGNWALLETPNFPAELAQCQYYAEDIPIYFTISNGSFLELFVPYKVTKRIAPTVTVSTVSTQTQGNAEYYDGSGWVAFPVTVASYTNGFRVFSNGVPSQNAIIQFKAFADADL